MNLNSANSGFFRQIWPNQHQGAFQPNQPGGAIMSQSLQTGHKEALHKEGPVCSKQKPGALPGQSAPIKATYRPALPEEKRLYIILKSTSSPNHISAHSMLTFVIGSIQVLKGQCPLVLIWHHLLYCILNLPPQYSLKSGQQSPTSRQPLSWDHSQFQHFVS